MTGKISGAAKGTMQESRLKHSVDVISQVYYLVIGFEVNGGREAFFCGKEKISRGQDVLETTMCVHDLVKGDYGHAFFYTSDNSGRVINFFSFGPAGFSLIRFQIHKTLVIKTMRKAVRVRHLIG